MIMIMLDGILDLVIEFITSRKINIIMIILNLANPSMIKLNIITLITKPSNHSIKSLFCTSHHMHPLYCLSPPLISHILICFMHVICLSFMSLALVFIEVMNWFKERERDLKGILESGFCALRFFLCVWLIS